MTLKSPADTLALPCVLLGCTLAIVSSLFATVSILVDINQFQDDAFADMGEFRSLSNNAWDEMIIATRPRQSPQTDPPPSHPRSSRAITRSYGAPSVAPFDYVEGTRFSRHNGDNQQDDPFFPAPLVFSTGRSACSKCSQQASENLCEAGERGPPGEPGEAGFDGLPGTDGLDGLSWMAAMLESLPCTACPQGPPGEEGPPGFAGPLGPPGDEGMPGRGGAEGRPGLTGPPGAIGRPGQPGAVGGRGRNGLPSIRYKGLPGGPGPSGIQGASGPPGLPGMPGPRGLAGDEGGVGVRGRNGTRGADGAPGAPGDHGTPGRDAIYCPCPARGFVAEAAAVAAAGAVEETQPRDDYLGVAQAMEEPVEQQEEEETVTDAGYGTDGYGTEPTPMPELTVVDSDQTQVNASNRIVEEYRNRFRGLLRRWRTRRRVLKLRQAAVV